MNKVLSIMLVLVVVAVAGFTMLSPKQGAGASAGHLEFLPSDSNILFVVNSPLELFKKINFKKYPEIFQKASENLPFHFTDEKFYHEKGFDFSMPAGFAVANIEKMAMVLFCGVKNNTAFSAFLEETIFAGAKIQPAEIAGIPCFLVQREFSNQPESVFCYKNGYFILYGSGNPELQKNLLLHFEKDILDSGNSISKNEAFQESLRGIKDQGDILYYMDYPRVIQFSLMQAKRFQPEQSEMMQSLEKMAEDVTSLAVSFKLAGNELQMHSYMGFKKDSELLKSYQGKGSAEDILKQLPANPLICMGNSTDMQKSWELAKPGLDMLLSLSPLGQQFSSIDALFEKMEKTIQQNFEIKISVEKDILQNIQGTNALVLYNLPSPEKKAFDLVLAMKLNNASKMQNLLNDILDAMQKKHPDIPLKKLDIEGIQGISLSLQKMQLDTPMEPALCISGDYLLLLSQKQIWNNKKGCILDSLTNPKVLDGLKKGIPSTGYIQFGRLVGEILNFMPPHMQTQREMIEMVTNHFQELVWTVEIVEKGMYSLVILNSDGDFLGQIFEEVSKIMQQMNQNPK